MHRFYYPDGQIIQDEHQKSAKEIFIEFYSKIYWYLCNDWQLENRIKGILRLGCHDKNDLVDIFKWKTGAMSADYENGIVSTRWNSVDINEIFEIIKNVDGICDKSLPVLLTDLMSCQGYGAVYALTVVFFVSKGQYPIYDKYAHIALIMINSQKNFNSIITDTDRKKEFNYDSLDGQTVYDDYINYKESLTDVFGEIWMKNRAVDQALWTYGHLFSDNCKNRKRINI